MCGRTQSLPHILLRANTFCIGGFTYRRRRTAQREREREVYQAPAFLWQNLHSPPSTFFLSICFLPPYLHLCKGESFRGRRDKAWRGCGLGLTLWWSLESDARTHILGLATLAIYVTLAHTPTFACVSQGASRRVFARVTLRGGSQTLATAGHAGSRLSGNRALSHWYARTSRFE